MQTTQLPLDQEWKETMTGLVDLQDGNAVLTVPLDACIHDMEMEVVECGANGWQRDQHQPSTWLSEHGIHVWLCRSE